ncbi:conserved hypothetical protein [Ricinus communis]|uniref:Squalene cyclase N-terminal domain-containing protein n=1 Tax=Ricinus communis TaxID=3988 RepID=B9SP92_RICCO|nr:conserved hypothetical protein [Ricinus communis]
MTGYVECTALLYPGHRRKETEACIAKAMGFIESTQQPDGSWKSLRFLTRIAQPITPIIGILFLFGPLESISTMSVSTKSH